MLCDLLIQFGGWLSVGAEAEDHIELPVPCLRVVDGCLLVPIQKIPFKEPVKDSTVTWTSLEYEILYYFLLLNSVWKFNYNLSKIMYDSFQIFGKL